MADDRQYQRMSKATGLKMFGGILNEYVRKPKNLTVYTAFRGVTDWTQIGQFDQFETGYSFLSVIQMPKFLDRLATITGDADLQHMIVSFEHMLEYEFRGLDGIPDISSETTTISNGVQDIGMISKVTSDASIQISSTYYEKAGGLITRFSEYYLTGIKDRQSQAKTYHGLIALGELEPGYENEVFTLMYYVTDNTYLKLERAFLFANAQLTKVDMSMYNSQRGDISNKEYSIEFNCYPIWGRQIDYAAEQMLMLITGTTRTKKITGEGMVTGDTRPIVDDLAELNGANRTAVLDSADYEYQIINPDGEYDLLNSAYERTKTEQKANHNSFVNGSGTIGSSSARTVAQQASEGGE